MRVATRLGIGGAVLALFLSACGSPAAGGSGSLPPPIPIPTPNPLTVTPHLDPTAHASATVPVSGGSVSLTGADGTTFRLTLPEGALLSPETITLTALDAVDGLPLSGGLLAGVAIEPDGLRLMKPATLTVDPSAAVPAGDEPIGFGFHGAGREFHLMPVAHASAPFTVSVSHFSGYGVGAGTSSDVGAQQDDHPPTSTEDWVDQSRSGGSGGTQAIYAQGMELLGLAKAGASDLNTLLIAALGFTAWEPLAQADPLAAQLVPQVGTALDVAANVNAHDLYTSCIMGHDLTAALELARLVALSSTTLAPWVTYGDFDPLVYGCVRFQLTVDSTLGTDRNLDPSLVVQLKGSIPIHPMLAFPLQLYGSATLHHGTMNLTGTSGCTGVVTGTDDTAQVLNLSFGLDFSVPTPGVVLPPQLLYTTLRLDFNPGDPVETITAGTCPTITSPYWLGVWNTRHHFDPTLRLWSPGTSSGVVAELHFQSAPGDVETEDSTFDLLFTPGP